MSHTDHNNNVDLGAHYDGWGYEGNYAPSTWKNKYPLADGKHQSPIDINTQSAEHAQYLVEHPLNFFFDTNCFSHIVNTGSSFKVSGADNAVSKVVGGPVCEEHRFLQFHAHWGKDDTVGSEHLVDGKSYAAELHFVNWNSTRYPSPNEAVQSSNHDGLIVLGVFLDVGEHNPEFDKIVKALSHIKLKGQEADLKETIDYTKLFPANTSDYWTYEGSLTTPPCSECVQWVVYKNPIHISRQQLQSLHDLYICKESNDCCDALRMSQNFRPICDLNSRPVKKSFK